MSVEHCLYRQQCRWDHRHKVVPRGTTRPPLLRVVVVLLLVVVVFLTLLLAKHLKVAPQEPVDVRVEVAGRGFRRRPPALPCRRGRSASKDIGAKEVSSSKFGSLCNRMLSIKQRVLLWDQWQGSLHHETRKIHTHRMLLCSAGKAYPARASRSSATGLRRLCHRRSA